LLIGAFSLTASGVIYYILTVSSIDFPNSIQ
jgi:hypothetical protein